MSVMMEEEIKRWTTLRNITAEWHRATREWKVAMNQFAMIC